MIFSSEKMSYSGIIELTGELSKIDPKLAIFVGKENKAE